MATSSPDRRIRSGCFVVLIVCLPLAVVFVTLVAVLIKDPTLAAIAGAIVGTIAGAIAGAFFQTPEALEFLSRLWRHLEGLWGHLEDFGVHWLDWVKKSRLLDWIKKSRLRVGLVLSLIAIVVISLVVGAELLIPKSGPSDQCAIRAKPFADEASPTAKPLDPKFTFVARPLCNHTVYMQLTYIAGNPGAHQLDVRICFNGRCGTWVTISAVNDWKKIDQGIPYNTQFFFYIKSHDPYDTTGFHIEGQEAY